MLNTTGSLNTFIGQRAGRSNSTAIANTFVGFAAGIDNTTGQPNSFFGFQTGRKNTTGNLNAFYGYLAGEGIKQEARIVISEQALEEVILLMALPETEILRLGDWPANSYYRE